METKKNLKNQNINLKNQLADQVRKEYQKATNQLELILNKWKNTVDQNYPISGSNIFSTKEYIKTFNHWQDQNVQGQQPQFLLNFLWTEWRFFENLLTFENDEFLEDYGHRLAQIAIFNGVVCLYDAPLTDEPVALGVAPIYTNSWGKILKAKAFLAPFIAPEVVTSGYEGYGPNDAKYQLVEIDMTKSPYKDKVAFWKWNSLGLTSFWEYYPFVFLLTKIFGYFQENIPLAVLNWIFYLRNANNDVTERELKMFRDKTLGVKIVDQRLTYTDESGKQKPQMGNEYKIEEFSRHPNEFTSADFNIVKNIMNYCTTHFANANEKRERNTVSETSVNTIHFGISWQEYLKEAKIFVKEYNRIFNKDASVKLTYDLFQQNKEIIGNQNSVEKGGQNETSTTI